MDYKQYEANSILNFFADKKFFLHRNILLLLIVMTISAETAFNGLYTGILGQWFIFIAFCLIPLSLILFNLHILAPKYLLKNKFPLYFSLLLLSILFSIFLILISQYFSSHFGTIKQTITYHYSISIINIFSIVIILGFACLSSSSFLLFQQWIIHEQKINQLKNINSQSELEQLKNQINPHFLFNMLNNATVLTKKNPVEASVILNKLSDLLKYQIIKSSQKSINLNEDIKFISDFLNLEKIRRDHFEFTLLKEGNNSIKIPPLLFITFVENAVKHNTDNEYLSYIHIKFKLFDNKLVFSCINSKPKEKITPQTGGLGLANSKRRLELLYPNKHILTIEDKLNVYIVNLTLFLS